MTTLFKTLKVGQLVRVVSTVKTSEGKTLVSHGCKGFVGSVSGEAENASYSINFPKRTVTLTAEDVRSNLKTCKGRPRKVSASSTAE